MPMHKYSQKNKRISYRDAEIIVKNL